MRNELIESYAKLDGKKVHVRMDILFTSKQWLERREGD